MGTKTSKYQEQHTWPSSERHQQQNHDQVQPAWDHSIARAGDNNLRLKNQGIGNLRHLNGSMPPSAIDIVRQQEKPFRPPVHNQSARRKRHHNPHTQKEALGLRKSRSAGNLLNINIGLTPQQLSHDQAKRRQRHASSSSQISLQSSQSPSIFQAASAKNIDQASSSRFGGKKLPRDLQLVLIDANDLKNPREIGKGNFGTVYHALYKGVREVALKTFITVDENSPGGSVNESDDSMRQLLGEANIMAQLKHPNVLRIVGVTFFGDKQQLSLVTDFMKKGSLLSYLHKHREPFLKSTEHSVSQKLNHFGRQIYEAMAYLEERSIIHRDLAARNCLIGEGDALKIGDFGLTKLAEYGLYSGTYHTICAPRWTSPEAFFSAKYSSRSDVWSYGITLWEVYSLGDRPFGNMNNYAFKAMLKNSSENLTRHLPNPHPFGSDEIYTHIILPCLTHNVAMRPRFRDLKQRILTILTQAT